MTSYLYECLSEAGLLRYYPRFSAMGLSRLTHLSQLTMGDYPRLGVQDMGDRTRLFHLVQLVKGFEEEEGHESCGEEEEGHKSCGEEEEGHESCGEEERAAEPVSSRRLPPRRRLDFSNLSPELETPGPTCEARASRATPCEVRASGETPCGAWASAQTPCGGRASAETPFRSVSGERGVCRRLALTPAATRKLVGHAGAGAASRGGRADQVTLRGDAVRGERGETRWAELSHRKYLLRQEVTGSATHRGKGHPVTSPVSSARWSAGRSAAERIRVCVRKRPLSRAEERRGEVDVVTVRDEETVLVHDRKEAVDLTQYVLQHKFYFDEVFGEASSNEDVYKRTAQPLIQHILSGGKATCFAYGQTGAGKTHTMLGSSPRRPGLYALAARDIFARLAQDERGAGPGPGPLSVCVSFFEIYCGQLYDLLDHRKREDAIHPTGLSGLRGPLFFHRLFAREDGHRMVQIAGLREVGVESVASLLEVISWGSRRRSRGVSGVNCDSSRSHALLQIHLRARGTNRLMGRISFVDLAGSEKASDTRDPDRQSRMEGAEINQSLLALKECIRALDQEQSHTPFRQSKLTQVLKDSFIGNSKTCMIANISPSHLATEHTLNTLRYADRVKELKRKGRSSRRPSGAGGKARGTPSPKSTKHLRPGKSPTKRAKLGAQQESRGAPSSVSAGMLFSPGANLLCSTPKARGSGAGPEGAVAGLEGGGAMAEVCLDHTTPLRGTVGRGRGLRGREEEAGGSDRGEAQEAWMSAGPVRKETVSMETLRSHAYSWRKGREGEREETERERHLRRYHQHLQQFLPSGPRAPGPPAPPVGEEGTSRGRSDPPHALELGHCGRAGPREGVLNAAALTLTPDEVWEDLPPGWGRGEGARERGCEEGALQEEGVGSREGLLPGAGQGEGLEQGADRLQRGLGVIAEGHQDRRTPLSSGAGSGVGRGVEWGDVGGGAGWGALGAGDEEEESWEGERETERGSERPALIGWSLGEEAYSASLSTESSSSSNNVPERPLLPPRTSAALLAENLNDLSQEIKCSNSHPQEGRGLARAGAEPPAQGGVSVNIALPAPPPPALATLGGSPASLSPREAPPTVTSSAGAEPQASAGLVSRGSEAGAATPEGAGPPSRGSSPSAADSSASTMEPLSISLLQVEQQAASDSFLRPDSSPSSPEGVRGQRGGVSLILEALLDIRTYWAHYESAVAAEGQKGQQSFDLSSALQCVKEMSASEDPALSLTSLMETAAPPLPGIVMETAAPPLPGIVMETAAQPYSDYLELKELTASPGDPDTQDPAEGTVSPAPWAKQSQSEPSSTESSPLKLQLLTENSLGVPQETTGDSMRTDPEKGEGLSQQGEGRGQQGEGRLDLHHKIPPTGGAAEPHCTTQDRLRGCDPSVDRLQGCDPSVDRLQGCDPSVDRLRGCDPSVDRLQGCDPSVDRLRGCDPSVDRLRGCDPSVDRLRGCDPSVDRLRGCDPSVDRLRGCDPSVDRPQGCDPSVDRLQGCDPSVDRLRGCDPSVDRLRGCDPSVDRPQGCDPSVDRLQGCDPSVDRLRGCDPSVDRLRGCDPSVDRLRGCDPSVASSYPQHTSNTHPHREGLGPAQWLVVQAHCAQLEEMDSLCHREEALLSSQPSMDFTDYVRKLEEIMELKAKCVQSMRAQLQMYQTCSSESHPLTH